MESASRLKAQVSGSLFRRAAYSHVAGISTLSSIAAQNFPRSSNISTSRNDDLMDQIHKLVVKIENCEGKCHISIREKSVLQRISSIHMIPNRDDDITSTTNSLSDLFDVCNSRWMRRCTCIPFRNCPPIFCRSGLSSGAREPYTH